MTTATPSPLLVFLDGWTHLTTKDVTFDKVFKPNQEDTEGLELLRSLESFRRAAVFEEGLDATHLDRMLTYLQELEAIVAKLEPDGTSTGLVTQWTSPMAGKPSYYHKMEGLAMEMGMATFMYGSALRAAAIQLIERVGISSGSQDPERAAAGATAATEASTLLRRAAGVFQWLEDKGLARIAHKLPTDRPAESMMPMAKIYNQLCLAEAQMVTAARAEQRGMSPSVTCTLHAAAWELWEAAARTMRVHTPDFISTSDHLRRYLASSATICRVRALRSMATDLRVNKEQAGQAEAACLMGASLLTATQAACDANAAWRQQAQLEAAVLEECRLKCQKDREHIYYQQIAKTVPDLPPGKVMVAAIPFQLTAQMPEDPHSDGAVPRTGTGEGRKTADSLASALDHSVSLRDR